MAKEFFVTPDHLKLVKAMYIGWDGGEFGAPAVDCKRPYGNSSVYEDMGEILGITHEEDFEFTGSQRDFMYKLHAETQECFEIMTSTLSLKVGKYERQGNYWKYSA